jgi:hypothetical protein
MPATLADITNLSLKTAKTTLKLHERLADTWGKCDPKCSVFPTPLPNVWVVEVFGGILTDPEHGRITNIVTEGVHARHAFVVVWEVDDRLSALLLHSYKTSYAWLADKGILRDLTCVWINVVQASQSCGVTDPLQTTDSGVIHHFTPSEDWLQVQILKDRKNNLVLCRTVPLCVFTRPSTSSTPL